MTESLPPLTPLECDLRDFPRMMIDITRLRASAFDATPDDAAWRAGVNLWFSGFHSIPAASLDNDDGALCKAAGLGRDLRTWRKVRAAAMRGWVLCSDGRWYHLTVAEVALEAWLEKLTQRLSSGAGNAKRWGAVFDPEPVKAQIGIAIGLLSALNPASKALPKASRHHPTGTDFPSHQEQKSIPSGSQGEGNEKGRKVDSPGEPPPPGSRVDGKNADFLAFFAAFPKQEQEKPAAASYALARAKGATAAELLDGAQRYSSHVAATKEPLKFVRLAKTWLAEDGWRDQYGAAAPAQVVEIDPSWGSHADRLTAALDKPVLFGAYFAAGRFVDGDPPRIQFKSRTMRDLAERKCAKALKATFGEIVLEVAA